jgi:hypothetical protein
VTRFSRQFVCSQMDKAKGHTEEEEEEEEEAFKNGDSDSQ